MRTAAALAAATALALGLQAAQARPGAAACRAGGVRALVGTIVRAFSDGDLAAFDGLVAKPPAFRWYSVSGRPGRRVRAQALTRSTLLAYVAARHRQAERQRVVSFRLNAVDATYAHFGFAIVRSARDHPAKRVSGKGAVDCTLQPPQIAVWSLGA